MKQGNAVFLVQDAPEEDTLASVVACEDCSPLALARARSPSAGTRGYGVGSPCLQEERTKREAMTPRHVSARGIVAGMYLNLMDTCSLAAAHTDLAFRTSIAGSALSDTDPNQQRQRTPQAARRPSEDNISSRVEMSGKPVGLVSVIPAW